MEQRKEMTKDVEAQEKVIVNILQERIRQDTKWGVQNHPFEWWLAILGEEYGELAQAILENHFTANPQHQTHGQVEHIRKEAIQVAAVAMALVECIDRNGK